MPRTIQNAAADAVLKAADALTAALLNLPQEKRAWKPAPNARTARNQVAECALLNGCTADLLTARAWQITDFDAFFRDRDLLADGEEETLQTRLHANAQRVADAIRALSDDDLEIEIEPPWRRQTLAEIIAYPHWNMSYHEGQINYIASLTS